MSCQPGDVRYLLHNLINRVFRRARLPRWATPALIVIVLAAAQAGGVAPTLAAQNSMSPAELSAATIGLASEAIVPSITLNPTAGPPGTAVIVTGRGFAPGANILFTYIDPVKPPAVVNASTAGADGSLPQMTIVIPSTSSPGALGQVVARDVSSTNLPADTPGMASALFGATPFAQELSAAPGVVSTGGSTQVSGAGFAGDSSIQLILIDASGAQTNVVRPVSTTVTGALLPIQITMPLTATAGVSVIDAVDAAGNVAGVPLVITNGSVETALRLSPTVVAPGESVSIAAGGFQPGEALQVVLDDAGQQATLLTTGSDLTADASGHVDTTIVIPLNDQTLANPPSGRIEGFGGNAGTLLTVVIRGVSSGTTLQAPVVVSATTLVAGPLTAVSGHVVTIVGKGYHANEIVTVAAVDSEGTITQLGSASASSAGAFSMTISAPAPALGVVSTQFTLSATGEFSDLVASAVLKVVQPPTVSFSNFVVAPGQSTMIRGVAFSPSVPITVTVYVTWPITTSVGAQGPVTLQATTDVVGAFSIELGVSPDAPTGPVQVQAMDDLGQTAESVVTVNAATANVRLSAISATPGKAVTVSGSGFASGETVALFLSPPSVPAQPVAGTTIETTADAQGSFSVAYVVPQATPVTPVAAGGYLIWARGAASDRQAAHGMSVAMASGTPAPTPRITGTPSVPGCKSTAGGQSATSGVVAYFPAGRTTVVGDGSGGSMRYLQELHVANAGDQAATLTVEYIIVAGSGQQTRSVTFTVPAHSAVLRSVSADVGTGHTFSVVVRGEIPSTCQQQASGGSMGLRVSMLTRRLLSESSTRCAASQKASPATVACTAAAGVAATVTRALDAATSSGSAAVVSAPAQSQGLTGGPSTIWHFAEGNTGPAFDENINLFNPDTSPSTVQLSFYSPAGLVKGATGITLKAFGTSSIDVRAAYLKALGCSATGKVAPKCAAVLSGVSIGVVVRSSDPIVAERTMFWGTGAHGTRSGYDVSPGATAASSALHFAYASTSGGDQSFLSIVNPSAACGGSSRCVAQATVSAYASSGVRIGSTLVQVGPGSRATVPMSKLVGSGVFSLSVHSTAPVVAELAQYVGGSPANGEHPGFDSSGARGGTALAASGFETGGAPVLVRVFNPTSSRIAVHITGWESTGAPYSPPNYLIGANASLEIVLPAPRAATSVQSIGVTVACTGICVAAGLQGVRGATVALPAHAGPEAWGGPLD